MNFFLVPNPYLVKCVHSFMLLSGKREALLTHIWGICDAAYKPQSPEDCDKIVLAEIPNPNTHPVLHNIFTKFMMHGPCGIANRKSPCMVDGCCSKNSQKIISRRHMHAWMGIFIIRGGAWVDV